MNKRKDRVYGVHITSLGEQTMKATNYIDKDRIMYMMVAPRQYNQRQGLKY